MLQGRGARYESRYKARKQACDIVYIPLQRLNTQHLVHDIAKVDISYLQNAWSDVWAYEPIRSCCLFSCLRAASTRRAMSCSPRKAFGRTSGIHVGGKAARDQSTGIATLSSRAPSLWICARSKLFMGQIPISLSAEHAHIHWGFVLFFTCRFMAFKDFSYLSGYGVFPCYALVGF